MADDLRARDAADRLRTYLELLPNAYALGEIAYDERFRSSDWPRTAYHPNRDDLLAVLGELDQLRAKVEALEACYEGVAADALAHGTCSLKQHGLLQRAEKAEAERNHLASACRTTRRRLTVLGAALPPGMEFYVGKVKAMRDFLSNAVADIPPTESDTKECLA